MNEIRKIGCVIVSHGQVANELLSASETVVGDLAHLAAVSIGWHDEVESAKEEILRAIEQVSEGRGVLLLTDMFGGTPTNISAMFYEQGEVEIVTGVNLPMVIRVASQTNEISLTQMADEVEKYGKESIYQAGDLLVPQNLKADA
jgi:mannose PTS system EIIA component